MTKKTYFAIVVTTKMNSYNGITKKTQKDTKIFDRAAKEADKILRSKSKASNYYYQLSVDISQRLGGIAIRTVLITILLIFAFEFTLAGLYYVPSDKIPTILLQEYVKAYSDHTDHLTDVFYELKKNILGNYPLSDSFLYISEVLQIKFLVNYSMVQKIATLIIRLLSSTKV